MSNIVNALLTEYGELAADIRKNPDPRSVKLDRIAALLSTYGIAPPPTENFAARGTNATGRPMPSSPEPANGLTKRERVRQEIVGLVHERGGRVHRNVMLERLTAREIMGHEKDPMASLASYLSDFRDVLDHDNGGYWWLKSSPPANGAQRQEGESPLSTSGAD